MTYTNATKKATLKYIKDKQAQVTVRFRKDDYDNRILPAIKKSGKPISTYIKDAVDEKIQRDEVSAGLAEELNK